MPFEAIRGEIDFSRAWDGVNKLLNHGVALTPDVDRYVRTAVIRQRAKAQRGGRDDVRILAEMLTTQGCVYALSGRQEDSLPIFDDAVQLFIELDPPALYHAGGVLNNMAIVWQTSDQPHRSKEYLERARAFGYPWSR